MYKIYILYKIEKAPTCKMSTPNLVELKINVLDDTDNKSVTSELSDTSSVISEVSNVENMCFCIFDFDGYAHFDNDLDGDFLIDLSDGYSICYNCFVEIFMYSCNDWFGRTNFIYCYDCREFSTSYTFELDDEVYGCSDFDYHTHHNTETDKHVLDNIILTMYHNKRVSSTKILCSEETNTPPYCRIRCKTCGQKCWSFEIIEPCNVCPSYFRFETTCYKCSSQVLVDGKRWCVWCLYDELNTTDRIGWCYDGWFYKDKYPDWEFSDDPKKILCDQFYQLSN